MACAHHYMTATAHSAQPPGPLHTPLQLIASDLYSSLHANLTMQSGMLRL